MRPWELWRPQTVSREQLLEACRREGLQADEEASGRELAGLLNAAGVPREVGAPVEEMEEPVEEWEPEQGAKTGDISCRDIQVDNYCHIAGGLGSPGAFLLQTASGVLVVKEAKDLASDVVCAGVVDAILHLLGNKEDLVVPAMRPLQRGCAEADRLTRQLLDIDKRHTKTAYADVSRIHRMKRAAGILLMEYISGHVPLPGVLLSPSMLRGFGTLLLLDLITNNWDRFYFPAIWNNEGNLSNVWISGDRPAILDQSITPILHQEALQQYHSKLLTMADTDPIRVEELAIPVGRFLCPADPDQGIAAGCTMIKSMLSQLQLLRSVHSASFGAALAACQRAASAAVSMEEIDPLMSFVRGTLTSLGVDVV